MNIGRLSAIDKNINSVLGIENCVFYLWSVVHRKTAWEFNEIWVMSEPVFLPRIPIP